MTPLLLALVALQAGTGITPPSADSGGAPAATAARYPIVPRPRSILPGTGAFVLQPGTRIIVSGASADSLSFEVTRLAEGMAAATGVRPRVLKDARAAGAIRLALTPRGTPAHDEGYRLQVTADSITIAARATAGLFYGIETLLQLVPPVRAANSAAPIPAVTIEDAPRFQWRGMHLDVGRHFFPVEFIERYIDLMARYKMNTFHWHLTEDQGWRIEIRGYPRLTDIGAWRKETVVGKNFDPYIGDRTPYGGYYTQDEIRRVVAYARDRHVTIVPEIEMPGHSLAALAAYPALACTDGPFEVATRWGVFEDIFCPSERTFAFLEDVLAQVMELFPGTYIHIGGDEAPKRRWRESALAQEVMRREGLADEGELQSWFIRRIGKFLMAHHRRLVGWDEILEGGLPATATVMSWRGMEGGIAAARQGHDVVMTPGSHVYLDHYQGDPVFEPLAIGGYTPLETVYRFEPVPAELTLAEASHVLGAQGNVWTEYIATPEHVEYMIFPRLLALSEVLWSPRRGLDSAPDWEDFIARLPAQLQRLDALGVHYRIPEVRGLEEDVLTLADTATVTLATLSTGAEIRYTLDGRDPTRRDPLYEAPFTIELGADPITVTARSFLPDGRVGAPARARFARTTVVPAAPVGLASLVPGTARSYYPGRAGSARRLDGRVPASVATTAGITLPDDPPDAQFGVRFSGYIRVPATGVYTFIVASDDGSLLRIADRTVVNNDGAHSTLEKRGAIALGAGLHAFDLLYFDAGGGRELRLQVRSPDGATQPVPAAWLRHLP